MTSTATIPPRQTRALQFGSTSRSSAILSAPTPFCRRSRDRCILACSPTAAPCPASQPSSQPRQKPTTRPLTPLPQLRRSRSAAAHALRRYAGGEQDSPVLRGSQRFEPDPSPPVIRHPTRQRRRPPPAPFGAACTLEGTPHSRRPRRPPPPGQSPSSQRSPHAAPSGAPRGNQHEVRSVTHDQRNANGSARATA